MAADLDRLARMSSNGHGGFDGEMLRRKIREANPDTFAQAEMGLAKLRGEALALIKPFLKRLVASLDESLNELAAEAEQRIERRLPHLQWRVMEAP